MVILHLKQGKLCDKVYMYMYKVNLEAVKICNWNHFSE